MEFFNQVGKKAIGSRLRMLTEKITEDAAQIYKDYNVDLKPKWFPVFYVLSQNNEMGITHIAGEIGQGTANRPAALQGKLRRQKQTPAVLPRAGPLKERFLARTARPSRGPSCRSKTRKPCRSKVTAKQSIQGWPDFFVLRQRLCIYCARC